MRYSSNTASPAGRGVGKLMKEESNLSRKRARGNGDADVWPRKNKEGKVIGYRGAYWVYTAGGKKRRYVSGKTKAETRAALNKAKADAAGGLVFDAKDLRLGE
jgi:integrase